MLKQLTTPAREIMEVTHRDRIVGYFGAENTCTFELADSALNEWRKNAGRYTVFTAGAYDLLGLNHVRGLIQCRLLAAIDILGLSEEEANTNLDTIHELAASDEIALMVTVDSNTALEEGKSRNPAKGGAPKPTLDWLTRAAMIGAQSIPLPNSQYRRNVVDYITIHGPGCCATCPDGECINEDNAVMAAQMKPDLVVVGSGSKNTIRDIGLSIENGVAPNTKLAIINEAHGAFTDRVLSDVISTTAIINRIKS